MHQPPTTNIQRIFKHQSRNPADSETATDKERDFEQEPTEGTENEPTMEKGILSIRLTNTKTMRR